MPGATCSRSPRACSAEEQDARHFLNESKGLQTGQLHIGAVGPYHVTEMLAAFSTRYPGILLRVSIGNSADVQRDLLDYKTDIAVLAHIADDERLLTIPYRQHRIVMFAHKDHRLARRKSISLKDLEGERMIVRETGSTTRRNFEAATRKAGVTPEVFMEIGSREAIRGAVIRGLGISYVSEAEFVPDPALRQFAGARRRDLHLRACRGAGGAPEQPHHPRLPRDRARRAEDREYEETVIRRQAAAFSERTPISSRISRIAASAPRM